MKEFKVKSYKFKPEIEMKVPTIFAFTQIFQDNSTNSNRSVEINDFFCDYLGTFFQKTPCIDP
jgi:hypothetical protein